MVLSAISARWRRVPRPYLAATPPRSLCRRALDHGDCGGEKDVLGDAVACLGTGRGFQAAGEAGATPRPGVLTRRLADPAVAAERAAQIVRPGPHGLAPPG